MSFLTRIRGRYRVTADPLRTERRVELLVLVLVLVVLLQLLWAGVRSMLGGELASVAPAADSLLVAEVPRPQSVAAEDSAAVQARPLFWAERRPAEDVASAARAAALAKEAAEAEGKPAPKMKDVTLLGVFGSGKVGGAIVSVKGKQERLVVGSSVQDWRLHEVAASRAVFVSGGVRDERELLPRAIPLPADAAGDVIMPGVGQRSSGDNNEAGDEPRLTLGGSS